MKAKFDEARKTPTAETEPIKEDIEKEKTNIEDVREDDITIDQSNYDTKQKKQHRMVTRDAEIGDRVMRMTDNLVGTVVGIKTFDNGIERLILELDDGSSSSVFNDTNMYRVIFDDEDEEANKKREDVAEHKKRDTMVSRYANIGDKVMRTSDNLIGTVVEIKKLGGGIERLVLELEDGSRSGVFNDRALYKVIVDD